MWHKELHEEIVWKLVFPETPWGICKELSEIIINMTLSTPRKFQRELIIPCGILRELSEVMINVTNKILIGEWEGISLKLRGKFYREISVPYCVSPIFQSITTPWNECENTKFFLQRYITSLLQWVWLNKSSNKFIQSVYQNVWWTNCGVELRSIENGRMWLETCPLHTKKSD